MPEARAINKRMTIPNPEGGSTSLKNLYDYIQWYNLVSRHSGDSAASEYL